MKEELTKLTCDECFHTEMVNNHLVFGGALPFGGWVRGANSVLDFCSAKCASKYFGDFENK